MKGDEGDQIGTASIDLCHKHKQGGALKLCRAGMVYLQRGLYVALVMSFYNLALSKVGSACGVLSIVNCFGGPSSDSDLLTVQQAAMQIPPCMPALPT